MGACRILRKSQVAKFDVGNDSIPHKRNLRFYNSAILSWIVSLQAGLTVAGNTALALATYQIYSYGKENESAAKSEADSELSINYSANFKPLEETNADFGKDMFFKSLLVAFVVKYGELFFDAPFNPQPQDALALIVIPTLLNVGKWASRSKKDPVKSREPSLL
jgi:hypothetical protein